MIWYWGSHSYAPWDRFYGILIICVWHFGTMVTVYFGTVSGRHVQIFLQPVVSSTFQHLSRHCWIASYLPLQMFLKHHLDFHLSVIVTIAVTFMPNAPPVAVRPQWQKDELETQRIDMLAQGIIRPSTFIGT